MEKKFIYLFSFLMLLLSLSATSCDKGEDEETTDAIVIEKM